MKKSQELRAQQQAYVDAITKKEDLHSEAMEVQRGINERKIYMADAILERIITIQDYLPIVIMDIVREIGDLKEKKEAFLESSRAVRVPPNVSEEAVRAAEEQEDLEDPLS